MNNIELNKVAIQSIGIDTIRLPGVGLQALGVRGVCFTSPLLTLGLCQDTAMIILLLR